MRVPTELPILRSFSATISNSCHNQSYNCRVDQFQGAGSGRDRKATEIGFRGDLGLGVLGAPLRAGATHVVPLGLVAVEQLAGAGEPKVSDGLADARWVLPGYHDTFPSSRRVPTAGSAVWSRRKSA